MLSVSQTRAFLADFAEFGVARRRNDGHDFGVPLAGEYETREQETRYVLRCASIYEGGGALRTTCLLASLNASSSSRNGYFSGG